MKVAKCPNDALALSNCVIFNQNDILNTGKYVLIDDAFVFTVKYNK
jgi:hypothetical protein